MKQHIETIKHILEHGDLVTNDRSGSGMFSVIGIQEKYPLLDGSFPLVTTRKINFEKTLLELIWFIKGNPDTTFLENTKVPFWTKWTSKITNTIGPMYPLIWRNLPVVSFFNGKQEIKGIDQLAMLVSGLEKDIQTNTISRRHYLSNVNLGLRPNASLSPTENVENGFMALDTCHREFFVSLRELTEQELIEVKKYREEQAKEFGEVDNRPLPKYKLKTCLTMRSNDVAVGKPHNIAQYACMNFILAHVLNCHPGEHVHQVNDAHIYLTHVDTIMEQAQRECLPLPKLYISQELTRDKLLTGDIFTKYFFVKNYQHHPALNFSLEG